MGVEGTADLQPDEVPAALVVDYEVPAPRQRVGVRRQGVQETCHLSRWRIPPPVSRAASLPGSLLTETSPVGQDQPCPLVQGPRPHDGTCPCSVTALPARPPHPDSEPNRLTRKTSAEAPRHEPAEELVDNRTEHPLQPTDLDQRRTVPAATAPRR